MVTYSSKYIGDKLYSYCIYEEFLLRKLINKIERKYHKNKKYDKYYYTWGRGYYTSNGFNKHWNPFKDDYTVDNELYEDSYFYDGLLTYNDLPCIYFDFNYHRDKLLPHYKKYTVHPSDIIDRLMEVAMIKDKPIIIEDLRHSSNALFFRVIIPLSYYTTRNVFYHENKKYEKIENFRNAQYDKLLHYLRCVYHPLPFSKIYMIPNFEDCEMEYYLLHEDNISFELRQQWKHDILKQLYDYCEKRDLLTEFYNSHIILTTRL